MNDTLCHSSGSGNAAVSLDTLLPLNMGVEGFHSLQRRHSPFVGGGAAATVTPRVPTDFNLESLNYCFQN